ncbi:hypothetical protein [Burkholderia pseudomallei]|uniref:hypothetical protein n=1 Tax=Burkholderia pseudomallei TaxID=28450 RepID=UPI000A5EDEB2|nr:hypothetical protein [Burkholderia pseudomallei]
MWIALFAVFAMMCNQQAHAQALLAPVENFVINRAEAAILTRIAIQRGFAANDPRIAATLAGMGKASTALNVVSTGAGVALAFAGAPVWATLLAGAGIIALGTALQIGLAKLQWNDTSVSIDVDAVPASAGDHYEAVSPPAAGVDPAYRKLLAPELWAAQAGIPTYRNGYCQPNDSVCNAYPTTPGTGSNVANFWLTRGNFDILPGTLDQAAQFMWYLHYYNGHCGLTSGCASDDRNVSSVRLFFAPTINIPGNPIEMYYTETGSQAYVGLDGKTRYKSYVTTAKARAFQYRSDIVPSLVAEDVSKLWPKLPPNVASIPLPSSTLTKLVDETWKRAATDPDYKGLPYEPVYDGLVKPWVDENPKQVPTLGDLFTAPAHPGKQVCHRSECSAGSERKSEPQSGHESGNQPGDQSGDQSGSQPGHEPGD